MGRNNPQRSRRDPAEEAKVVAILAFLAALGPFVVLGLGPLVQAPHVGPLATWEKVVLVGLTPLFAVMSLLLFARSSGARARKEARAGAALAAVTLALALASAAVLVVRG